MPFPPSPSHTDTYARSKCILNHLLLLSHQPWQKKTIILSLHITLKERRIKMPLRVSLFNREYIYSVIAAILWDDIRESQSIASKHHIFYYWLWKKKKNADCQLFAGHMAISNYSHAHSNNLRSTLTSACLLLECGRKREYKANSTHGGLNWITNVRTVSWMC